MNYKYKMPISKKQNKKQNLFSVKLFFLGGGKPSENIENIILL